MVMNSTTNSWSSRREVAPRLFGAKVPPSGTATVAGRRRRLLRLEGHERAACLGPVLQHIEADALGCVDQAIDVPVLHVQHGQHRRDRDADGANAFCPMSQRGETQVDLFVTDDRDQHVLMGGHLHRDRFAKAPALVVLRPIRELGLLYLLTRGDSDEWPLPCFELLSIETWKRNAVDAETQLVGAASSDGRLAGHQVSALRLGDEANA
eukprot:CAMPEP_0183519396 /NCGR_PEP_ID=MMETSP0371-20130417/16083_1 /TAXON_ID=268820 /ORGANISM="Peridinium aciculiferum, Strain PAER-2" /LENGTH=208 /DNA_ID=CAMNT_0025717533 /DNA_START=90 /DNA_END=716 /DNA_ORIENTATION=-